MVFLDRNLHLRLVQLTNDREIELPIQGNVPEGAPTWREKDELTSYTGHELIIVDLQTLKAKREFLDDDRDKNFSALSSQKVSILGTQLISARSSVTTKKLD